MQILIVIPTYNERENLPALVEAIFNIKPEVYILIVDDHSPDGTGKIAEQLKEQFRQMDVVHRPTKLGLGTAYIHGFKKGISQAFDLILEMDADFSHDPRYLPELLRAAQGADLVIGSRYVSGGNSSNWNIIRRFISQGCNRLVRAILKIPVSDCTSGFRCYRRSALEAIDLNSIRSQDHIFQVEILYQMSQKGMSVVEIPIAFCDRQHGRSKASLGAFLNGVKFVITARK